MMRRFRCVLPVALVLAAPAVAALAQTSVRSRGAAEGQSARGSTATVELQIVHDPDYPATNVPRWYQLLTDLKVDRLEIRRGAEDGAEPTEIETRMSRGRKQYVVHGRIDQQGRLHVGKQAFALSSRASLAKWLEELRKFGPGGSGPKANWGLGPSQFARLQQALKRVTPFRFQGEPIKKCLDFFAAETRLRIELAPSVAGLAEGSKGGRVTASVERTSLGTALAYSLSTVGWVFEPRESDSGDVYLLVMAKAGSQQPWPIGSELKVAPAQWVPLLAKFGEFNLPEQPVPEVLAYFSKQLDVDLLVDAAALQRKKLDLGQYNVALTIGRELWGAALRRLLFQFGLHPEPRVDEAGHLFFWITAAGRVEPVGTKAKPPQPELP